MDVKSAAPNSQNLAKNEGEYYHIQGIRLVEMADSHFVMGLIVELLSRKHKCRKSPTDLGGAGCQTGVIIFMYFESYQFFV
ncbi:hypothetical protein [Vibrio furnissii]|uniref:hypothetical protein n=1 Tax=Vibrio furnissii TaxID=29494 RepID=UPI001EEC53D8|nr:hypothetical protein [Vibrio furnissii]TRN26449.1 hypothetical protein DM784_03960 [Vibrio furnissii]